MLYNILHRFLNSFNLEYRMMLPVSVDNPEKLKPVLGMFPSTGEDQYFVAAFPDGADTRPEHILRPAGWMQIGPDGNLTRVPNPPKIISFILNDNQPH